MTLLKKAYGHLFLRHSNSEQGPRVVTREGEFYIYALV